MPFLYAQVKERCDRCLIKHYLLDLPSLSKLLSFCNDNSEVGRVLQIPVQELVTFSPVYDNVISDGGFADDVEFLEEEIYSGKLTNEIAKWLLQISEQSANLLPGRIGMHLPGQSEKETPCKTSDSLPLIIKTSHALQCAMEQQECSYEIKKTLRAMQSHSFLFRSIYLKIPKDWQNAECDIILFERIESHVGKSSENARVLACNSGFLEATLDIWNNWNIIRETRVSGLASQVSSPVSNVTYNVWGTDIDGTLQGAGGVGGLLAVIRDDGAYLPTYDANGNISEYVSATDGTIAAHYDYSPFGEPLVASGPLAATFTHRFSTKPYCPFTGFSEYQMRKYRPDIGRWMSRDPIHNMHIASSSTMADDFNGLVYCFCNNSIVSVDVLGLVNTITHRGRCCNKSAGDEWALVSEGEGEATTCRWVLLHPGECVGSFLWFGDGSDCEGMTCGGGFYRVTLLEITGNCITPRCDSLPYKNRRWTPCDGMRSPDPMSPDMRCSGCGLPPDHIFD